MMDSHEACDLTVSIVSYNTRELLRACLQSLLAQHYSGEVSLEIIVADNGSSDGTVEMLQKNFPQVHLIETGVNLGYGRANNLALQNARGRHYLILNSDTEVPAGTLKQLCNYLDSHSDVGAVSAQLIFPSGELQASSGKNPNLFSLFLQQIGIKSKGAFDVEPTVLSTPQEADWLCGACFCVRREAFRSVGGFDPSYFMYLEDCDLSLRLRKAEWKLVLLPASHIVHHLGASSENWQSRARMIGAYNRSCVYYFASHSSKLYARIAKILCLTGTTLRILLWAFLTPIKPDAREKVKLFLLVWRETEKIRI